MAAKFQESNERKERKVNSATVKSLHSRSHKALEENTQGTQLPHWQASKRLVLGATSHIHRFKEKKSKSLLYGKAAYHNVFCIKNILIHRLKIRRQECPFHPETATTESESQL